MSFPWHVKSEGLALERCSVRAFKKMKTKLRVLLVGFKYHAWISKRKQCQGNTSAGKQKPNLRPDFF